MAIKLKGGVVLFFMNLLARKYKILGGGSRRLFTLVRFLVGMVEISCKKGYYLGPPNWNTN
ncbi:MAG: hypothetical protein K0Q73_6761 [Paenibacillus sp.]|nr:hypothetical protein [Paenibacillus sp.]